ncbi:hypothetical protein [Prolixibacter sp. NT017]|uniref:hypothetical protein n=1 Tax=Prolixibacter sp. NT017 TaxID=2652390 RepID=UPI00126BC50A|nr:hypothetical protein [Prolixibacter sp. NT017]GET23940.1 hypothetical protein NT017_02690 [Prolixibacter sp. NT017]
MKNKEENNDDKISGALKLIGDKLPQITAEIMRLAQLPVLTPEEEVELTRLLAIIKQLKPLLESAKEYLDRKLLGNSISFYYAVKEKAEQGNPDAQKIIADLGPLYQQMLLDDIEEN